MNEIQRPRPRDLITTAGERKELSLSSVKALQDKAVLKQIESGLSGSHTVTKPGSIRLVTLSLDDSPSIFMPLGAVHSVPYTDRSDAIIAAHNALRKGMEDGPMGRRTMLHTRYLNGKVLNPFMPLPLCRDMSRKQYWAHPTGGTPLYTQSLATLGIVIAKANELTERGARATSATLFITDGEPTDHSAEAERKLFSLVTDMRAQNSHIIAGLGIGHQKARFCQTFESMGIDPSLVFLAKDIGGILEAFGMFGKKVEELEAGSSTEVGRPTVFQM